MHTDNLESLLPKLEKLVNKKMNEFAEIGREAKRIRNELDEKYIKMKTILHKLAPIMPLVRDQNPELIPLFDELLKENN